MNNSGIHPVGRKVLVLPDEVESVTEGGIVIPETEKTKYEQAVSTGVLIAVGPDAFRHGTESVYRVVDGELKLYEKRIDGYETRVTPGQRIVFAKFGGKAMPGMDGKHYRVMNDEDITALADEGVEFGKFKEARKLRYE